MPTFSFVDIDHIRYTQDREPNECPICRYAVQPEEVDWALMSSDGKLRTRDVLEIVYKCPRRECARFFVARYKRRAPLPIVTAGGAIGSSTGEFALSECVPQMPKSPYIPDEVAAISPLFVSIYSQSCAAEIFGLDQIAGGGYRKAVEFLIKDYCISINADAAEDIKHSFLANCIAIYVDSPQIKLCAERAAWLGNDELHYVRRWTDKDLSNLKELIVLTMNWIQSSILTQKYTTNMPKGNT